MREYLLKCKAPPGLEEMLAFMAPRAISGLEVVEADTYARTFRTTHTQGYFTVHPAADTPALVLRIHHGKERCHAEVRQRVRRMFDMDRDPVAIERTLCRDPVLAAGIKTGGVPPLPIAFDPFEFTVRAILGQQITVKAATTLASRVAGRAKLFCGDGYPAGLSCFFPDAAEMMDLDLDGLGITRTRQNTLKSAARAYIKGRFTLDEDQPFETFQKTFSAVKGIGDWTVNYVAMRGLGMKDSFPATDLGVIKALTRNGTRPTRKQILEMAERWRPFRSYATLCLWRSG